MVLAGLFSVDRLPAVALALLGRETEARVWARFRTAESLLALWVGYEHIYLDQARCLWSRSASLTSANLRCSEQPSAMPQRPQRGAEEAHDRGVVASRIGSSSHSIHTPDG